MVREREFIVYIAVSADGFIGRSEFTDGVVRLHYAVGT
jgi:hypothetical protein